ncbi:MAG: carbon monoxide dehydrogenase subunit G [Pseudomonadales bacterium]|nr:carbon monoxide dehydrogenase subunit G [Pseudomonadales bacterium]
MELIQQVDIPAAVPLVWLALNDPEVLKQSLTGCESFTENASGSYEIVLLAKVGPVKARFAGEVTLSDIVEEQSYTLSGGGKGGVAGHAKGSASVSLIALENGHTTMRYSVQASVGGKIAQLGSRLVDGAARKMANEFFTKFIRVLCEDDSIEVTLETITG